MNRRFFLTAAAAATALPLLVQTADATTWQLLGVRKVNGPADFDSIHVGAGKGTFTHLKVKVRGNALWSTTSTCASPTAPGRTFRCGCTSLQGGTTRNIDLRGTNRNIRRVNFTYGKLPNGRGATYVELWGMR
ncbi:MAG: hypothetical protein H6891_08270 [Brucellaceae bacterium]|nr:hypothetical protein [Brucellaceae bacterium]